MLEQLFTIIFYIASKLRNNFLINSIISPLETLIVAKLEEIITTVNSKKSVKEGEKAEESVSETSAEKGKDGTSPTTSNPDDPIKAALELLGKKPGEDEKKPGENETKPFEVSEETFSKYSFSSEEFNGMDEQIDTLREQLLLPVANSEMFSSLGITSPLGVLFDSTNATNVFLKFGYAFASALGKIDEDVVKVFERKDADTFPKYSGKAVKFLEDIFAEVEKHKGKSVVLIDSLHTLLYNDILSEYEKSDISRLTTLVKKQERGKVFVFCSTEKFDKLPMGMRKAGRVFELEIKLAPSLGEGGRGPLLTQGTASWAVKPDTELLKKVEERTEKFSREEISDLCANVLKAGIQKARKEMDGGGNGSCKLCKCNPDQLKVDKSILPKVNPSFEDWEAEILSIEKAIEDAKNAKANSSYLGRYLSKKPEENLTLVDENMGFEQVGGLESQISNLKENIIFPLDLKEELNEWGVEPVRGIIFHGPPGTGKTLLGRALAAELGKRGGKKFSFFYKKSSDLFNLYVGETERMMRELFKKAEEKKPCILFFDEIDGMCPTRSESRSSNFSNSVVTTMLGLMDSVTRGQVFVIAATNRLDSIDSALRRPGRFDKIVAFHLPKKEERENILQIHTKKWKQGNEEVTLKEISKLTEGYSGADLEQLSRQTFVTAMRRHFPDGENEKENFEKFNITMEDWTNSLTIVKRSSCPTTNEIIGKSVSKEISLLLESRVTEIVKKLQIQVKNGSKLTINHFLLYGKDDQLVQSIHNFLLPCLLSSKALEKSVVAFTLTNPLGQGLSAVQNVVRQVTNVGEGKMGILLLPLVDKMLSPREYVPVGTITPEQFSEQISLLRGENVVIIGTSSKSPDELRDSYSKVLFPFQWTESRAFQMTNLGGEEVLEGLFQDVLQKYPKLLEGISNKLDKKDLTSLVNLRGEIEMELCMKTDENEIEEKLAKILRSFESFEEGRNKSCFMYT